MILAFIFTAFHLSMLLTAGTDMDPYITLRGICANFLLGWCFSRAFKITRKPSLRMALFGLTAALLALSHAHVQINGSYPDIRYAGLAADRVFIYSILSDRTILWRVLIYTILTTGVFVWSETKGLEIQLTRDGKTKVLFILISAYGLGSIFPACDVSRWEASSVVDFNLHSIFFKTTSRARDVEVDGRRLIAREYGDKFLEAPGANVIIVMIEGLSKHFVTQGYMPELRKLWDKGLSCDYFLNHQRQTNRGIFSVLCGAYPNLATPDTKSDLMALRGVIQHCLPQRLAENGYHTAFLQSANLGYMSKDLFAEKAGFEVSHGEEWVKNPDYHGPWGVDDKSLYRQVLEYIKNQKKRPYFLTLLTSSTHPPFKTKEIRGNKKKAFEFAGSSISWFHNRLKAMGELENTVLIITSDESSASTLKKVKDPISHLRGFLLVLGDKVRPGINPGTYGQVDIAYSVLDLLNIDPEGFGGRSIFQKYDVPRTLFAGNTFSKTIYALGENGLLECNQSFRCFRYSNYPPNSPESPENRIKTPVSANHPDVVLLKSIVNKNDMSTKLSSIPLVTLPKRVYGGMESYQILGRYISTIPKGDNLLVKIGINNNLSQEAENELGLEWLAYDCTGSNSKSIRQKWTLPSGKAPLELKVLVPQLYDSLCHKVWVFGKNGKKTKSWELSHFSIEKHVREIPP